MIPKAFLLLLFLGSATSDRLRYHLEHLINGNVSACDNFYDHVCSQYVDPSEFFRNRVASFVEVSHELRPQAIKNSPIAYDLERAKGQEPKEEDNKYAVFARGRCKEDIACYHADQIYYANFSGEIGFDQNTTSIYSNESSSAVIARLISDTSAIINFLITVIPPPFSELFEGDEAVEFFNVLQSRADMIEFMKSNSSFSDFHEICGIAEIMKNKMLENIESSKWLHGDEISNFIREKIEERVASIQIYHDFDEYDRNMTYIFKLNRDFNQFYFSSPRKTGVSALDTLLGLKYAYEELNKQAGNSTEKILINRIEDNFQMNGFFESITKTVTMLAPYMHRGAFSSEILKEPLITYYILGHELYHSLFAPASPSLSLLYSHRGECVMNHYKQSCSKFAVGACASGNQTFNEDAPDLEAFRLLYSILRDAHSEQELNEPLEGLDTTLEQAFFYYVASTWCDRTDDRDERIAKIDPHSAYNIRINAGFSLLPEFSNAFGCKKGDKMFVEKENSCYIFGPNSA